MGFPTLWFHYDNEDHSRQGRTRSHSEVSARGTTPRSRRHASARKRRRRDHASPGPPQGFTQEGTRSLGLPRWADRYVHPPAEVSAPMTALPLKQLIPTDQALLFVREVRDRCRIVILDEDEYYET